MACVMVQPEKAEPPRARLRIQRECSGGASKLGESWPGTGVWGPGMIVKAQSWRETGALNLRKPTSPGGGRGEGWFRSSDVAAAIRKFEKPELPLRRGLSFARRAGIFFRTK